MKNNIMKELTALSVIFGILSAVMFVYFAITSLRPMPIILSAVSTLWYYAIYEFCSRHID